MSNSQALQVELDQASLQQFVRDELKVAHNAEALPACIAKADRMLELCRHIDLEKAAQIGAYLYAFGPFSPPPS